LERVEVSPVTRHQKDRTGSCLGNKINGPAGDADDGNHRDRHDQQHRETASTDYQTASLG
jgi:hypothetical protein